MIIGLARNQMAVSTGLVIILMSATMDVEELQKAIPGAREIEIDCHEFVVERYFLERPITKSEKLLVKYFDLPVEDNPVMGRKQPYYMHPEGLVCT